MSGMTGFARELRVAHGNGYASRRLGRGREKQPYAHDDRDLRQAWDDGWWQADRDLESEIVQDYLKDER